MNAAQLTPSPAALRMGGVRRLRLPDARSDRLFFAQVREDPMLEIEALRPTAADAVVVVGSGGCTALSLLAAGAGRVVAVDLNTTQNHLIELKAAAVTLLGSNGACEFLGGSPCAEAVREAEYRELRQALSPDAQRFWNARSADIRRGVLGAGVSERFIARVVGLLRLAVHPHARIERLLACHTLREQREFYSREWDTRRWRLFFRLLLNRWVFRRTYDPVFFQHLERPSFAEHFRRRAEHTLTHLPLTDNYFLHQMLTGWYPTYILNGAPPYLTPAGSEALRSAPDRLTLVDSGFTKYLRTCPDGSVHGFALSNICEWLTPAEISELFAEIVRTAAPGARLCFRNFVGWTKVPPEWAHVVVEDRLLGEALMQRDRSVVQRRFAFCRIRKEGP